jgi:hypothetical protein
MFRLLLILLVSFNIQAGTWWPSGDNAETFQNGFSFANGKQLNFINDIPEWIDGNGVLLPVDKRVEGDLLLNADFERSYVTNEAKNWTNSVGTLSIVPSIIGGGSRALQVALVAQNLDLQQGFSCDDYVGNNVGFSGFIKSSEEVEFCAYSGSNKISCATYDGSDRWRRMAATMKPVVGENCTIKIKSESITANVAIDFIKFSSRPIPIQDVANLTEWNDYVPTSQGIGTPVFTVAKWRQVGGNMELSFKLTPSTSSAAEMQIGLPNGESISTTEVPTIMAKGTLVRVENITTQMYTVLATGGDTFLNFGNQNSSGGLSPANGNAITGANLLSIEASIPIEGWVAHNDNVIRAQEGADSEILLLTGNGYGSTNTVVRSYITESINTGSAFTYSPSTTLGDSITVNESGLYFISRKDYRAGGSANIAVSRDSTQLTTAIESITATDAIMIDYAISAGVSGTSTIIRYLTKGSVLRAHDNGNNDSAGSGQAYLYVAKMGFNSLSAAPSPKRVIIGDVKYNNTDGGTFTAGDDGGVFGYQRNINNIISGDSEIVSISSNQFTLAKGEYWITVRAPAYYVNRHKAALRNVTDSILYYGESAYSQANTSASQTYSVVKEKIIISKDTVFEVRHKASTTNATYGLGNASNFSTSELYTTVEIEGAITNRY